MPIDEAFLHRLADAADQETLPRFQTELKTRSKGSPGQRFDPVTEADQAAERAMRRLIELEFPDHGIVGEEFGVKTGDIHQWVLDPIDGTRPFLCGIPVWGTLIGLTSDGRAQAGMMSQPFTDERFWAVKGEAWHKRKGTLRRLQTRKVEHLGSAILHTTSPELIRGSFQADFARLTGSVRMTRYGGECYATAMLCAGLIDLCLEPTLKPHDIVALIPLVEHSGGVVTTLDGGRPEAGGAILASGSPQLHDAALSCLSG